MRIELAVLTMMLSAASSAVADRSEFSADAQVTWSTAFRPEIQVIVRNRSDRTIESSVELRRPMKCDSTYPEDMIRLQVLSDAARGEQRTFRRIAPRSWSTDLALVGGGPLAVGCRAQISVVVSDPDSGKQLWSHDIEQVIVEPRGAVSLSPNTRPRLSIESVVERTVRRGIVDPTYMLRLKVTNNDAVPREIAVLNRRLVCPSGVVFDWVLAGNPVIQGADFGPMNVGPDTAVVFSQAVRGTGEPAKCTAEFTIGAGYSTGGVGTELRAVERFAMPLKEVQKVLY